MRKLRLSQILVGLLILGCVGSIALLAVVAVRVSTAILEEHDSAALTAARSSRQHYLDRYFDIIEGQLATFCKDTATVEALVEMAAAFESVAQETTGVAGERESFSALRTYYETECLPRLDAAGVPTRSVDDVMPRTDSARVLQSMYIALNPNAVGQKKQLDRADEACDYWGATRAVCSVLT